MVKEKTPELMEKIVSLSKRRGFIYQGSEIYGGLAGTWDYGPLGVALKKNIKDLWWKMFVESVPNIFGLDAAILMRQETWQASGHVSGFSDPLIECQKCKRRFRADHLEDRNKCPECNGELGEIQEFNMMFKTFVGPTSLGRILDSEGKPIVNMDTGNDILAFDPDSVSYLRPETAQGIFANFKNVLDSFHPSLPFGIAQIGKAFRNEIAPRDFIFRSREFEQMEIEYFIRPENWKEEFEKWVEHMRAWCEKVGINNVYEHDIDKSDLAHYSERTIDFEFDYPFGKSELYGLAYRTNFDLKNHMEASGVDLNWTDSATGEKILPHVIEPSLGVDRTLLAILTSAYSEEEVGGEIRVVMKFKKEVAPIKVAILPLMKKEPLADKAKEVWNMLKGDFVVQYDETQSIGKRYRRQDEIGTPYCVTVDFDTLESGEVTVRDRDTMVQEKIKISDLSSYFISKFKS
jgi:glycyl-tRNA synthetase